MAIAISLQQYLGNSGIEYDIIEHRPTHSSLGTARSIQISASQMAKPVVLKDDNGYLMAVIPAGSQLRVGVLSRQLNRRLGLATENELTSLFNDCELGAIPPLGDAYRMDVVLDDSLMDCSDVYFEAGDHTEVIHVRGEDFRRLMRNADHSACSTSSTLM